MSGEVVIAARHCGPPNSGNGGYVCGVLAEALGAGVVEATLRAPPPLDTPLALSLEDGGAVLRHGEAEIGRAWAGELDLEPPAPPSPAAAARAAKGYAGFRGHIFPTCFVCGPDRAAGEGLRLFPGPTGEGGLVAAPWTPDESAVEDACVPTRMVWAALDCPGYFGLGEPGLPAVLGRLTATVTRAPDPGEACIVAGWPIGRDGRKRFAGTAVYGGDGEPIARAKAVWIAINTAPGG